MSLTLAQILALRRGPAAPELIDRRPDGTIVCHACAHECSIRPGLDGICKVRSNVGGELRVPRGYVAGIQVDPIEKKPFFHALPGNDALSFGMLGCDLHCSYCFPPDVRVATSEGARRIGELFDSAPPSNDPERRRPAPGLRAFTDDGSIRNVSWIFRHRFEGALVRIETPSGPGLEATPDHPVLATTSPAVDEPRYVPANDLTLDHHLVAPRFENAGAGRSRVATAVRSATYVPIRSIARRPFSGWVYNLEVEDRHTYVANGFAVHNCQNWVTSQALRDPVAVAQPRDLTPEQLIDLAERENAPVVVSTYNEPLITAEWAVEVMRLGRERGLMGAFVSNGNATDRVLDFIRPYVQLYKIDLKSLDDKRYRSLGVPLEHILDGIRKVHARGFWLEIVTLVIPGFNDSEEELRQAARFIRSVSPDVPWHVTGFHDDYKMEQGSTSPSTLVRACEIGTEEGLRFVYAGNRPGQVGDWENTRCPGCGETLIRRQSFSVLECRIGPDGRCPSCRTLTPGVWSHPRARARSAAAPAVPRRV